MPNESQTLYAGNTGSSFSASVDDTSSGKVQIVKLAISTDGSDTLIPADSTYGIDADVTRIASGASVDIGARADGAGPATGVGDASLIALLKRIVIQNSTSIDGLTITNQKVDITSGTTHDIYTPTGGKKAFAIGGFLTVASAVTITVRNGSGGTILTKLYLSSGIVFRDTPLGLWAATSANVALHFELNSAVNVAGVIKVVEIT